MANSNIATASSTTSVVGSYIQPSSGIVIPATTDADVNGNLQQSIVGPNAGLAYMGMSQYRDCQATVQGGSKASAPSAGGTLVSITPGTVGLWEITGVVAISGTTVGTVETNNLMLLANGSTLISAITYPVQSTTGGNGPTPLPATIVQMTGTANTVQVQAVANSTASSVYSATLVARRVG
jgi:hypothetical protein